MINDQNHNNEVLLDFTRENRTGLSEAILCQGKQLEQLAFICEELQSKQRAMLFTRMTLSQFEYLDNIYPGLIDYDAISKTGLISPRTINSQLKAEAETEVEKEVAIVAGGSSDVPVAKEAERTLAFYGISSLVINDVGVAGLWRLNDRLKEIESKKIVICIAGMDAALPTVLGGLIPSSIIAVPTSVGYGMVKGGETALRALLVSCAPGILVVNIDNGYGAACAALRILNQLRTAR